MTTGSAANVTATSATLTGTVNANGLLTIAGFQYGTTRGIYSGITTTQTVTGSNDTTVSITITGLTAETTYYYRIVAQNSAGISTGSEASFTTKTLSPTPSPSITPPPTPQVSPSPLRGGGAFGDVKDGDGYPLQGVTVTITGDNFTDSTDTDGNGKYEFRGLAAGDYTLTYKKDGYQTQTQSVSLEEGEVKDLGTVTMEEQTMLGKIYGYVVDIRGNPIESVKLKLKGLKTKLKMSETSDGDGFFEFTDLEADTYVITAQKKRYRNAKRSVSLEEGDEKEIEIEMRKSSKRVIEMMEDGQ